MQTLLKNVYGHLKFCYKGFLAYHKKIKLESNQLAEFLLYK